MNEGAPWWWIRDEEARALGIGVGAARTTQGVVFGDPEGRIRLEIVRRDAAAPLQLGPVSVRVWGAKAEEPEVTRLLHRLGKTLHARRAMDFDPGRISFVSKEHDDVRTATLIDVPSVCLRACAFCAMSKTPHDARRPRGLDADVERQIDAARSPVLFTGDDALAHPKIQAFIQRASAHGPVSLVGPPRREREPLHARALADAGLARWSSGLFGADASTHDAIAGEVGAFEALHASCQALSQAGVHVELITPLVTPLLHTLPAIVALGATWTGRPVVTQLYVPDPSVGDAMDAMVPVWPALRAALALLDRRHASIEGVPPCLVPEPLRSASARLDRSERNEVSYPEGPCGGCALRPFCPGIAATSLRVVGTVGLGA
jgi:hypothetical protein